MPSPTEHHHMPTPPPPIVIAIDGPSASGKSTNSKLIAKALGFVHVDTGAMYRTLAWYCLQQKVDVDNEKAVAAACRRWHPKLVCENKQAFLTVDGYHPATEIRSQEVTHAVSHVAAVPYVREWMKKTQRSCVQFGHLVMEGRDIGTNIFPETDFKYFLDAKLDERSRRRAADGLKEDLAKRDRRDSQRATAPLMVALGAKVIDNSKMSADETSALLLEDIRSRLPTGIVC